jgi:hypothetical protein
MEADVVKYIKFSTRPATMKSILPPFLDAIRHVRLIPDSVANFDLPQRRLVLQQVIEGVVVGGILVGLRRVVPWIFEPAGRAEA